MCVPCNTTYFNDQWIVVRYVNTIMTGRYSALKEAMILVKEITN